MAPVISLASKDGEVLSKECFLAHARPTHHLMHGIVGKLIQWINPAIMWKQYGNCSENKSKYNYLTILLKLQIHA